MTRLAVDQLITELDQGLVLDRAQTLAGVRARLYFHNVPAGTFAFNFYKGATKIASYYFTSATAQAAVGLTEPYFWADLSLQGYLPLLEGEYSLKLEAEDYTFNSGAWVGWVKDFSYRGELVGEAEDFSEYPYTYKLLEYGERELAR